jgi:hypothetical protein
VPLGQFLQEVIGTSASGIPALHLPYCGTSYLENPHRLALIGEATGGWGNMKPLLEAIEKNPETVMTWNNDQLKDLPFFRTNNFGKTFWDTSFKLLAAFNGVPDWKSVKRGEHPELLQSYVWANSNSLEGYEITAKWQDARHEDWIKFKNASKRFDHLELVLEAYAPRTAIIMNWDSADSYTPKDLVWEKISDHLEYARSEKYGTHLFRTAHPRWLNKEHIYEQTLENLVGKWNAINLR